MDRKEQLLFCKVCNHKKFDLQSGLICKLSNAPANFSKSCSQFDPTSGEKEPEINAKHAEQTKLKKRKKIEIRLMQKREYYLLLTSILLSVFVVRFFSYSFELAEGPYVNIIIFAAYFFVASIAISQHEPRNKSGLFLRTKFQFGFLLALFSALLNYGYVLVIRYHIEASFLGSFIAFAIINFFAAIFSLAIQQLIKKRLNIRALLRISTIIVLFLFPIAIIQSTILIPNERVQWDENKPISYGHFKGFPNYLSSYAGAISSNIGYEAVSTDSLKVYAYSRSDMSWIKNRFKSTYLLNHERYHFHISELVARMVRKKISYYQTPVYSESLMNMYSWFYTSQLNDLQHHYDLDTEHSTQVEEQIDWQFMIDSMLLEYAYYKSPWLIRNPKNPKADYYRNYYQDGRKEFRFIYPVHDSMVSKIACYRIDRDRKNRIIRIAYLENGNIKSDPETGAPIIEIEYNGEFEYHYIKNANDELIADDDQVSVYKIHRIQTENEITIYRLDENKNLTEDKENIAYIRYTTDNDGFIIKATLHNKNHRRIQDKTGFYEIRYRYNDKRQIITRTNYNRQGEVAPTLENFASIHYDYDEWNNIRLYELFDEEEQPVEDSKGIARLKFIYDEYGYLVCEAAYNKKNQLITNENGIAFTITKFNAYGFELEEASYGINRNLKFDKDGYGKVKWDYDKQDRIECIYNYDAYNQIQMNSSGFAVRKFIYDGDNSSTFIMRDFIPDSINPDKIIHLRSARCIYKNDLLTEYIFLDDSLKPSLNKDGIIRQKFEYNSKGLLTSKYNFSEKNVMTQDADGIAGERYRYDSRGNLIEKRKYLTDGMLLETEGAVAIERFVYDNENRIVEESYYNSKDQLMKSQEGYAVCKYIYGTGMHPTLIRYFDEYNTIYENDQGIAAIHQKFNSSGNLVELAYLNRNNNLQADSTNAAITIYNYDSKNRLKEEIYFDEERNPVVTPDGYHKLIFHYDKNDNIIVQQLLDENNYPVEDTSGTSVYQLEYDRNGSITNYTGYGTDFTDLTTLLNTNFNRPLIKFPNYETSLTSGYRYNPIQPETRTNYITDNKKVLTTWYNNNQKESEGTYINGKLEGNYITWYKNGQMQSKIQYKNGQMEGSNITYFENGKIESMRYYKNNTLIKEKQTTWYNDGQLRSEFVDGEYREYDRNGKRII